MRTGTEIPRSSRRSGELTKCQRPWLLGTGRNNNQRTLFSGSVFELNPSVSAQSNSNSNTVVVLPPEQADAPGSVFDTTGVEWTVDYSRCFRKPAELVFTKVGHHGSELAVREVQAAIAEFLLPQEGDLNPIP